MVNSMTDMLDLLQCPVCGTFYKPETTAEGRTIPHCGVVDPRLTEGVVRPLLTSTLLDMEA